MTSRYKLLPLDAASAGMVLADDVCDHHGNVLLAKGGALSEMALEALRRRGIGSVRIHDSELAPGELEAERRRVEQRLAHLFRQPHAGAASAFLREQLASYRVEQLR